MGRTGRHVQEVLRLENRNSERRTYSCRQRCQSERNPENRSERQPGVKIQTFQVLRHLGDEDCPLSTCLRAILQVDFLDNPHERPSEPPAKHVLQRAESRSDSLADTRTSSKLRHVFTGPLELVGCQHLLGSWPADQAGEVASLAFDFEMPYITDGADIFD